MPIKHFAIAMAFAGCFYSSVAKSEWTDCPKTTGATDLKNWRTVLIQKVLAGEGQAVQNAVDFCFGDNQPKCYQDMTYYISNPSSNYGPFETKDLTLQSEAELPVELLAKDANGVIIPGKVQFPDNIREIAENKGWNHVLYKTRSTGGFDSAPNLFMLGISTPKLDIFLQTSPHPDVDGSTINDPIPQPRNGNLALAQNTLTVITVDKTKNPPVGQLRQMRKDINSDAYVWSNQTDIIGCIGCHTQPLRPISPKGYKEVNGSEIKMTPEQTEQIEALNLKLSQPTSWGSKVVDGKEIKFGPNMNSQPLGWAPKDSFTRQEEFLKKCSVNPRFNYSGFGGYYVDLKQSEPPVIDYNKLGEAMNCVKCHNGTTRGPMHEYYEQDNIDFKIAVDRSMPHGIDLNIDERLALIKCLNAERSALRETWRSTGPWMEQLSCFGKQFNGNPPIMGAGKNKTPTKSTNNAITQ